MVRPRLTDLEVKFLLECLKHTISFLDVKEREFKELESKVYKLRKEFQYNTLVWKELNEAREELEQWRGFPMRLLRYSLVCNSLIRRFEALLEGGHLHSAHSTSHWLRKLFA